MYKPAFGVTVIEGVEPEVTVCPPVTLIPPPGPADVVIKKAFCAKTGCTEHADKIGPAVKVLPTSVPGQPPGTMDAM